MEQSFANSAIVSSETPCVQVRVAGIYAKAVLLVWDICWFSTPSYKRLRNVEYDLGEEPTEPIPAGVLMLCVSALFCYGNRFCRCDGWLLEDCFEWLGGILV
jgi:hypothetical protein